MFHRQTFIYLKGLVPSVLFHARQFATFSIYQLFSGQLYFDLVIVNILPVLPVLNRRRMVVIVQCIILRNGRPSFTFFSAPNRFITEAVVKGYQRHKTFRVISCYSRIMLRCTVQHKFFHLCLLHTIYKS